MPHLTDSARRREKSLQSPGSPIIENISELNTVHENVKKSPSERATKKSPGRHSALAQHSSAGNSEKSRRSKTLRSGSGLGPSPGSARKRHNEHFSQIPDSPEKVVQLDVIESYGPIDEASYATADGHGLKSRVVAAR